MTRVCPTDTGTRCRFNQHAANPPGVLSTIPPANNRAVHLRFFTMEIADLATAIKHDRTSAAADNSTQLRADTAFRLAEKPKRSCRDIAKEFTRPQRHADTSAAAYLAVKIQSPSQIGRQAMCRCGVPSTLFYVRICSIGYAETLFLCAWGKTDAPAACPPFLIAAQLSRHARRIRPAFRHLAKSRRQTFDETVASAGAHLRCCAIRLKSDRGYIGAVHAFSAADRG